MTFGLLRAAWRTNGEVCTVRAVARQRDVLVAEQASWVQRIQKALVEMNIQLTEVLTDVMGLTGQAIIRDIVAGERDPKALARHRNARVKAKIEDITRAPRVCKDSVSAFAGHARRIAPKSRRSGYSQMSLVGSTCW